MGAIGTCAVYSKVIGCGDAGSVIRITLRKDLLHFRNAARSIFRLLAALRSLSDQPLFREP